jgi:hypothetical protein
MPNGLLPAARGGRPAVGRGAPGAGAWPVAGPTGRGGTGPGLGATVAPPSPAGRCRAACWALTAAACSALSAAARASAAATSMSCALAGLTTGGAAGMGVAFLAGGDTLRGGAGLADTRAAPPGAAGGAGAAGATGAGAAAGAGPPASMEARSRRATGASTVLDADFTYSPSS